MSTNYYKPIDWPIIFDRTPAAERTKNNRFKKSLRESIDDLVDELERLDVDDWRLSTDAIHQKKNPQYPYADSNPDDPGAVIRWTKDENQYAVACDNYSRLRDNVRTLYKYVQEKRKMMDRPVKTGHDEFANARLPPADDADVSDANLPAHKILGVDPDSNESVIEAAARMRKKETHPDQGGDESEFKRVVEAEKEMLNDH